MFHAQNASRSLRQFARSGLQMWLMLALAILIAAPASAAPYTILDLGTLGGSGTSIGTALNARGQVTGQAVTAAGGNRAFLYDGSMHDLGTLGGRNVSLGAGINDSGHVTGYSYPPGSAEFHAFLYDGTMHDLGAPGFSIARGINDSGRATGSFDVITVEGSFEHAFLYDGAMHDLGMLPGGKRSAGNGINASGQVTGQSESLDTAGNFVAHAFLYDGTMHDLGTLGGNFPGPLGGSLSQGNGINARGQVTGYSATSDTTGYNGRHAFFYDGTMHDLGTLGGSISAGSGINLSGQVTGYSDITGDSAKHAFLYDGIHGMVDLNSLINPSSGWVLNDGNGINDVGQITGDGMIGGQTHAFLLTPIVPEPSSIVLAAFGFTALTAPGWRKRSR